MSEETKAAWIYCPHCVPKSPCGRATCPNIPSQPERVPASDAKKPTCSCFEIAGEDPNCMRHGEGTMWRKENPDICELSDRIAALEQRSRTAVDYFADRLAALEQALDGLQQREAEYRHAHDLHGDGSPEAGRAWDLMRRAGDKARAALNGGPSRG